MNDKELSSIYKIIRKNFEKKKIPLSEPNFTQDDVKSVSLAVKKNSVSSAFGNFVTIFENKIKKITKAKHAIALINGTCSLQIALLALGLKRNQEVFIPALNFIASSNAVLYCGGIPHFIDVNNQDLGIDMEKLKKYLTLNTKIIRNKCINKKTKRIIAFIVPTHVFGHIGNMDELKVIAKKFKLTILEDASEALGSTYKNKHAGTFGKAGVLSFNGNKIITSASGGVILTNNKSLANQIRHTSSTARVRKSWEFYHNEIGFNYRMPNLNAALGVSQLNKLNFYIKKKRALFIKYSKIFKSTTCFNILKEPKNCRSNYWLQTIVLNKKNSNKRKKIILFFQSKNIEFRPVWKTLPSLSFLKKYPKMKITEAYKLEKKIINIPSSPNL